MDPHFWSDKSHAPTGGRGSTDSGIPYQFTWLDTTEDYKGNDCVYLLKSKQSIDLQTLGAYDQISILATAGRAGTEMPVDFSVTIHYTDNTTDTTTYQIPDWCFDRDKAKAQGFEIFESNEMWGTHNANIYSKSINCNKAKLVKSLEFEATSTADICAEIFAITGHTSSTLTAPTAQIDKIGKKYIQTQWNSVTGATSYRLDVATDENFENMVDGYNNKEISATSCNIEGLTPETEYYIRVRAVDSNGNQSLSSNVVNATTLALTEPQASDFNFTAPINLTYDGNKKTATVTSNKSGMGNITVKYYSAEGTELTSAPTDVGTYTVKIDVAEGTEYSAKQGISDSSWTFTINKATPSITNLQCANVVYGNQPNPSASTTWGTLQYKYSDSEAGPFTEWSTTNLPGPYYVKAYVEASDNWEAAESNPVMFMVNDKPNITINYKAGTGGSVSPASESLGPITGVAQGSTATAEDNYIFGNWTNESGTVVSTDLKYVPQKSGIEYLADTYTANFIEKATPKASDFIFSAPDPCVYDGNKKEVAVTSDKEGMGNITVKYYSNGIELTEPPTDAGTYTVKIDVALGDKYKAATDIEDTTWTFTIDKATPVITDLTCDDVVYGTEPSPSANTTWGEVKFKYSNNKNGPFTEWSTTNLPGTYYVKAYVEEGDNWYAAEWWPTTFQVKDKEDIEILYKATNGGSVSLESETLGPITGEAKGSTANADSNHCFVNWTNQNGEVVSTDQNFVPQKSGIEYLPDTYTANFNEINASGTSNTGDNNINWASCLLSTLFVAVSATLIARRRIIKTNTSK